jgi:hypothetical protein
MKEIDDKHERAIESIKNSFNTKKEQLEFIKFEKKYQKQLVFLRLLKQHQDNRSFHPIFFPEFRNIINDLSTKGLISISAFNNMAGFYHQNVLQQAITREGLYLLEENFWERLKNSNWFKISRDIAAFSGFVIGIILAIYTLLKN